MRITIEVVADEREDAIQLLKTAVVALRRGKEASGAEINHCVGDYRIVVEEDAPKKIPYKPEDLVSCTDPSSVYYREIGAVEHSGPKATGVRWRNFKGEAEKTILTNDKLQAFVG